MPDHVFKLSGRINSTWGGGLTDMVRSRRMLEIIEADGLIEQAADGVTHGLRVVIGQHRRTQFLEQRLEAFPVMVGHARDAADVG